MAAYNLAEAKAHLSDLVARAAAGESIDIMRRGEPMARLVPVDKPKKPIDVEALRRLTDSMPMTSESVKILRDQARY